MGGYEGTERPSPSGYLFPFLQLFLQAVTAGILRRVRDNAVVLVKKQRGNLTHAYGQSPAADPHVLQVVGQISADAFAAEAIVLAAVGRLQMALEAVSRDPGDLSPLHDAQVAAAQAKVAINSFAYKTASALFDMGRTSATQSMYNLDRHWRNVRAISACIRPL
jgi:alkylation response protein AidB-like acyl-CoA dehydrogenase